MKYMIFGAGQTGEIAYRYFGMVRIECFIDNYKAKTKYLNKKVISLEDALPYVDNYVIIIASEQHYAEIIKQLDFHNIKNYFIFREYMYKEINSVLPCYTIYDRPHSMSYDEILVNYEIFKYKKICIFGINNYIAYLITEIAYQNKIENIVAIINSNSVGNEIMGLPIDFKPNEIMGVPVVDNINDVLDKIDCLVINKRRCESSIRDDLPVYNNFDIIDIYNVDKFIKCFQHPELIKYKDIHKNKRVFIIGTGPSLSIDDLETLHKNNEICFGVNYIWKSYNRTNWRANYLLICDDIAIQNSLEILNDINETVFLADVHFPIKADRENINFVHLDNSFDYYPNFPGFSDDATKGFHQGRSVIYNMGFQMAAYMGFKEIYLIGVDHNYSNDVTSSENHFIDDYFDSKESFQIKAYEPNLEMLNKSYEKAKKYSLEHNFKIYNATRGGKLEVFERVDFDSLF